MYWLLVKEMKTITLIKIKVMYSDLPIFVGFFHNEVWNFIVKNLCGVI